MSRSWPKIRLDSALRHRKEFIRIDDVCNYKRARVQLHAQGIVLRDEVPGALIKTKQQQVCRAGEFLVAEIDAKVGGYGIVPPQLDGAIVSSHYFLFELDEAKLDRRFLGYFIRTPMFHEQVTAQGSTNYAAIRPAHVLGYEIPLPPIEEQRRIVETIEAISVEIDKARELRRLSDNQLDSVCWSLISHDEQASATPMNELVRYMAPNIVVVRHETYQFAGVYSFGRGVFRGQRRLGMDFSYTKLTQLRAGNFVYPKLMAWEGALGIAPPDCDGCVVSPEFPVFEVIETKVYPEVLDTYFRNPDVWPALSGASTGTNVRRRRLNPDDFLKITIPLPTRETQEKVRSVSREISSGRELRNQTNVTLQSVLPSVLDRAFAGKL